MKRNGTRQLGFPAPCTVYKEFRNGHPIEITKEKKIVQARGRERERERDRDYWFILDLKAEQQKAWNKHLQFYYTAQKLSQTQSPAAQSGN